MIQSNYNTENNKGKHRTCEDRTIIVHLFNIQEMNYSKISAGIEIHRTTIKGGGS